MDRNEDDAHADWSSQDVQWDGVTLTAQASAGPDANVPTIERYYVKGRGLASSGSNAGLSSSSCRVPGCVSDLSRDLAYFRKYRICREHLKSPVLVVEGVPSRFCQQCSRFHHVREFDGPQRTCRAMLERLRIKRNSGKNQAGRSGGRGKNDTVLTDATRRGACSSQSNSTGKDGGEDQVATGQQQLSPKGSGEGVDSGATATGVGAGASRRSGATSSNATTCSVPGLVSSNARQQPLKDIPLAQRGSQQTTRSPSRVADPRVGSSPGSTLREMLDELLQSGSRGVSDQSDLLELYLAHDAVQQQSRRGPRAAAGEGCGSPAATVAAMQCGARGGAGVGRDTGMADNVATERPAAAEGGFPGLLYRDAPYGLPPEMGSGSGGFYGSGAVSAAEALADLIPTRRPPPALASETLRPNDRGIRLHLAAIGRDESSLPRQLALPLGQLEAGSLQQQTRVLDLAQPNASAHAPAPSAPSSLGPVLNLGSRVDLSLELQIQDIYREMALEDSAATAPLQQQFLQQQEQRQQNYHQERLPCTGAIGSLVNRSSAAAAGLPRQPLVPLGHAVAAPAAPQPLMSGGDYSSLYGYQAAPARGATTAGSVLQPAQTPPQQQLQHQAALSDLALAMCLGADCMDISPAPPPTSLAVEMPAAAATMAMTSAGMPQLGGGDPMLTLQSAAAGVVDLQYHGSAGAAPPPGSNDTVLREPCATAYGSGMMGLGGMYGGSDASGYRGGGAAMAAIPEAGDGSGSWCGADDIDAAVDRLMEEAGSGAVYHSGGTTASLERICFKLHNLHPRDLPRDLMGAMGSWLSAARAEVVQGAIRPGCTQLILDVYANGPYSGQLDDVDGPAAAGGSGTGFPFGQPPPPPQLPAAQQAAVHAAEASCKAGSNVSLGTKARVLGGMPPSHSELAELEASIAAVGAEVLRPVDFNMCSAGLAAASEASTSTAASTNAAHLGAYVMHNGNVHTAAACFKKLLGPRAVQSMSVSVSHQLLTISGRDLGSHVTDVRGTLAGLDSPLLLSVSPLAVVAGARSVVHIIGSHLAGPGRRPQVRCQGAHVACSPVPAPVPEPVGGAGGVGSSGGNGGSSVFQKVRPYGSPALVGRLLSSTLPGSHRVRAAADCVMVDIELTAPDAGLLMVEWEADRAIGASSSGGVVVSDWLPVLAVPDAAMASEINRLAMSKEGDGGGCLRGFVTDIGLLLDYMTRINQHVLMSMAELMELEHQTMLAAGASEAAVGGGSVSGSCGSSSSSGHGSGSGSAIATYQQEYAAWVSRSGGGGADQRVVASPEVTASNMTNDVVISSGGVDERTALEHDSRTGLMARPRLSKRHYVRAVALAPSLLAFAADAGMPSLMSWLMDFMLEHVHYGDLAAVFQCVEAVGGGGGRSTGLPLLHRAVRSGNARAVRLLLLRASSHGLACNMAQPAGPYKITPLHLAALQPLHSGMLQACGCGDPGVAELWVTVTDAAGRTPAVYLRRQLDSLHTLVNSTAMLRAAAAAIIVPGGAAPLRTSASGSTSTTAYRSWGSEEPGVGAGTGANAAGGAAGGNPSVGYVDAQVATDEGVGRGARRVLLSEPRRDRVSSDWGGGDGAGLRSPDSTEGPPDSVEDFSERQELRRRGRRLADLGSVGAAIEVLCAEVAAAAVDAAATTATSAVGAATHLVEQPLQLRASAATAAAALPPLSTSATEQGNGRAPLQITMVREACSGATPLRESCSKDLLTGLPPTEESCAVSCYCSGVSSAAVVSRHTVADSMSATRLHAAFLGDSTEDWHTKKRELRARLKREQRLQQLQAQEIGKAQGQGAGGRRGHSGGEAVGVAAAAARGTMDRALRRRETGLGALAAWLVGGRGRGLAAAMVTLALLLVGTLLVRSAGRTAEVMVGV